MQQLSDNTPKALRSTSDIDELTEINGVSIERIEKRAEALEDKTLYENATTILNDWTILPAGTKMSGPVDRLVGSCHLVRISRAYCEAIGRA